MTGDVLETFRSNPSGQRRAFEHKKLKVDVRDRERPFAFTESSRLSLILIIISVYIVAAVKAIPIIAVRLCFVAVVQWRRDKMVWLGSVFGRHGFCERLGLRFREKSIIGYIHPWSMTWL